MRAAPLAMLLILAVAAPAMAQLQASPADRPRKPKLVCRTDSTTSSRIARSRVCATQAEWDELDRARSENTGNMLRRMGTESGNVPTSELMDAGLRARMQPGPTG